MSDPPFQVQCGPFLRQELLAGRRTSREEHCKLPLIDLGGLRRGSLGEREACASEVARAAAEWGIFQVVNHGVSQELLLEMGMAQRKLFSLPFQEKVGCGLFGGFYKWGSPEASSLQQFSWSEAFHIPLAAMTSLEEEEEEEEEEHRLDAAEFDSLRDVTRRLGTAMFELGWLIARILEKNLQVGSAGELPTGGCSLGTCFLRLNRYPPCRFTPAVHGLVPHTDSDLLTILHQDTVRGLQLKKGSRWLAVEPNPNTLVVNIGDLFQAWSNDAYRSVEHKVTTNGETERYSVAFFLCPSGDYVVSSCREPAAYRSFTFGEYRRQVQDDVKKTGQKVGLPRFRL